MKRVEHLAVSDWQHWDVGDHLDAGGVHCKVVEVHPGKLLVVRLGLWERFWCWLRGCIQVKFRGLKVGRRNHV